MLGTRATEMPFASVLRASGVLIKFQRSKVNVTVGLCVKTNRVLFEDSVDTVARQTDDSSNRHNGSGTNGHCGASYGNTYGPSCCSDCTTSYCSSCSHASCFEGFCFGIIGTNW